MTSKVAFVLGTRPEIIKLAPVIRACDEAGIDSTVVHTGQHYSESLDDVFFTDLELPEPAYNLGVGSGDHGRQTGRMMVELERILQAEAPDVVLVQGDTNSALAGGLVASKLDCAVGHVEAGLRSFDREMPEEHNRRLLDHVATWLFAPTEEAATRLHDEAIPEDRVFVTGNTIVDAVTEHAGLAAEKSTILDDLDLVADDFALLTAHRAGNVDDADNFAGLLRGVGRYAERADLDVIYPIHPHSSQRIESFDLSVPDRIRLIDPLTFLDFLALERAATLVFTDSGGVQEETCILGTPCVTLRENTERPETLRVGSNVLAGTDPDRIVAAAADMAGKAGDWEPPFGDGTAATRILHHLGIESPTTEEPASATGRVPQ